MRATAFAPAHISGFFAIRDGYKDKKKRGSIGAGICLSRGVYTSVVVKKAKTQKVRVLLNRRDAKAPVTRLVIRKLLSKKPYHVLIDSKLELPTHQGFGMSGASAISTALALNKACKLGLLYDEILTTAHETEIDCSTGLGDVVAQGRGGVEMRVKEGAPPFGRLCSIDWKGKLVCCVMGPSVSTKIVLENTQYRKRINRWGNLAQRKLMESPTIENFFTLSREFAVRTGLANEKTAKVIKEASKQGLASQCMLGNSVFATGDTKRLNEILSFYGKTWVCEVGRQARILEYPALVSK